MSKKISLKNLIEQSFHLKVALQKMDLGLNVVVELSPDQYSELCRYDEMIQTIIRADSQFEIYGIKYKVKYP